MLQLIMQGIGSGAAWITLSLEALFIERARNFRAPCSRSNHMHFGTDVIGPWTQASAKSCGVEVALAGPVTSGSPPLRHFQVSG